MSERYFAYGSNFVHHNKESCACPVMAALDVDDIDTKPVLADIAGMYDNIISKDGVFEDGVVTESNAKAAWLDMMTDLRPTSVRHERAVEVAEELGWV